MKMSIVHKSGEDISEEDVQSCSGYRQGTMIIGVARLPTTLSRDTGLF